MFNSRKDLDAAPAEQKEKFLGLLAASINKWSWDGAEWVLEQNTTEIEKFDFSLEDFPDAPVPEMPSYNPDERALEKAREDASLSRADFKIGLLEMGELDNVQALMDDPATDPRIKIMYEDSGRFNRMHPDLLQLAEVMGYTEEQLDELFGVNI